MSWITSTGQGVRIQVKVQPRSAKNEIVGIFDEHLKVKLTAPPVEGEANRMLKKFLGEVFKCGARNITILKGETGRVKLVEVKGVPLKDVVALLPGLPEPEP
ncbi:MAG TPA: YggU family protein [Syntrophomonadaceae bacterium]|nr:YggU family protein [Syntrophomonadaceae bacterium]